MTFAKLVIRTFERLGLRGGPTVLRYLSRTRLGDRFAEETLPSGVRMTFPAYDCYWARHLYAGVPYEPDVERIFRRFGKGRMLIDCGANIGYWSARHREFGFTGAIAIEASEKLIPLLRRNHHGPVHHAAVHSVSGATLHLTGTGAAAYVGELGTPVQSIALADLPVSGPVLVKLDVEGSEIPAIEGARGLDAIFVYEDWVGGGMAVTRYLLEQGYAVYGFDMSPISSAEEAIAFNKRTTTKGPSNFVALRTPVGEGGDPVQ